jgi:hypothetical protein
MLCRQFHPSRQNEEILDKVSPQLDERLQMRKLRIGFMCFLATLLVAFVAGCGQETITLPSVVSVTPAQGAANVALNTTITATFSQAMSSASINTTTFKVAAQGGAPVTGTVGYSGLVATFTPTSNGGALAYNTTYTATITTGAATPGGAELIGPYVWSFTTSAASGLTVAGFPAQGALVSASTLITATFNLAMNCTTLATSAITADSNFTVTNSDGIVPGAVTCTGSVATFVPTGGVLPSYTYNRTYTATITTGAKSSAQGGVSLPSNYVWSFTVTPPPTPAPTVTATYPVTPSLPDIVPIVAEDVNVPLNPVITANFSEPMAPATIIGANFMLTVQGSQTLVSGSVSYVEPGNKLVFQLSPNVFLQPSTTYTATITTGVQDLAGQPMANPYTWNFKTTAAGTNNTQPMLVSTYPADGALDVCQNVAVSATFSEAMNKQTFTSKTFYIYLSTDSTKTPIPGLYSQDTTGFIETFKPTSTLAPGTYIATVTDGATNMAGIGLLVSATGQPPNPWTFTTNTSTCQPPINLGVLTPFVGAAGGAGGMTNMGVETVVNGEIATTAAASSVTGFYDKSTPAVSGVYPCSYTVTGSNMGLVTTGATPPAIAIFTAPPPPNGACIGEGNASTYATAQAALAQALVTYNSLQSSNNPAVGTTPAAPQGTTLVPTELGGKTLYPGVYWSASIVNITNGDLTLDAQGDPTATFVFQIGSALTVGKAGYPASIILAHGAKAGNIFWLCGSAATINGVGGGTFNGTVIADATISTGTSGITTVTTINGRLISLGLSSPSASTTLVNTVINVPTQ